MLARLKKNPWELSAPTIRTREVLGPPAPPPVVAPPPPAPVAGDIGYTLDEKTLTALLDGEVAAKLAKEEKDAKIKEGSLSHLDLYPFNPDAPRGASSRLETLMGKQRELGQGTLTEQTDPKLLLNMITKLQDQVDSMAMDLEAIDGENQYLRQMIDAARQAGFRVPQGGQRRPQQPQQQQPRGNPRGGQHDDGYGEDPYMQQGGPGGGGYH